MDDDIPFKEEKAEKPVKATARPASKPAKEEASDDDSDMDYFRKLAEGKDED